MITNRLDLSLTKEILMLPTSSPEARVFEQKTPGC
jgi:hypothetical protein